MSKEVRPFEEYKEIIKDMTKEEMIRGLYDLATNCIEKDKEIERMQKRKEELQINGLKQETLFKLEIERLNNIINELEKWLEEDLKQVYRDAGHRHNLIFEVLEKLQELKGSNGAIPPEVIGTNGENGGLFDYGDR